MATEGERDDDDDDDDDHDDPPDVAAESRQLEAPHSQPQVTSPNSVLLPGETPDQALDRLLLEQRRQQTAEQSRARAANPWQVLLTSRGVP